MKSVLRLIAALLFAVSMVLSAAGCGQEISEEMTIIKNGTVHRIGASEPYTGIVTGIEKTQGTPQLSFRKRYNEGVLEGESDYYYPNGHLYRREPYKNGRVNGILSCYDENGRIMARIHLVNGERGGDHGEIFFE